jgi:photosystem II stability/assembly factor-like uncharacterized protein
MRFFYFYLIFGISILGQQTAHGQWQSVGPSRVDSTAFATMKFGLQGAKLFVATLDSISVSENGGDTWRDASSGLTSPASIFSLLSANGYLYASNMVGGIFRMPIGGDHWLPSDTAHIGYEALAMAGNTLLAGGNRGLSLSYDNGATWHRNQTESALNGFYSFSLSAEKVYAGSLFGILVSLDQGETWITKLFESSTMNMVNSLAVSGSTIFAGTWNGLFISNDDGDHWKQADTSLFSQGIPALCMHGNDVLVGCRHFVWISSDLGLHWTQVGSALNGQVVALTVQGPWLLAGANTSGVWRMPLSAVMAVHSKHRSPRTTVFGKHPKGIPGVFFKAPERLNPDPKRDRLYTLPGCLRLEN